MAKQVADVVDAARETNTGRTNGVRGGCVAICVWAWNQGAAAPVSSSSSSSSRHLCSSSSTPGPSLPRAHLYRIMVGRSRPRPQAMTLTPSGRPMGRSISGRNMPLLPTSIHLPSCSE